MVDKVGLPPSLDDVETLVIAKAISFALDLGLTSIIVEGDSEVIVKTLKCEDASFATFGRLISSTKFSMDAFNSISFSHTRRLYNRGEQTDTGADPTIPPLAPTD